MLFITLTAFIFALPMRETYKPVILKQRAKKHGLVLANDQSEGAKLKNAVVLKVLRPFHMLFTEVSHTVSYNPLQPLIVFSLLFSSSRSTHHSPLVCFFSSSLPYLISSNSHPIVSASLNRDLHSSPSVSVSFLAS
jgi:hypothetical protein